MPLSKEIIEKIQKEKDENNKIRDWVNKRSFQEIKDLAFTAMKLVFREGKTFADIENVFKNTEEAMIELKKIKKKN